MAFVEALSHSAVSMHSDQEPVLAQLLKAVQDERAKKTLMRLDARGSQQSQGKIENANKVISGVARAIWLALEEHLGENAASDSILLAWVVRHAAWSLTRYQVRSDGRTSHVRIFGKAYSGEVLPFGERVLYKFTAAPTGNVDQKWAHGIWVGKAPLTDEHLILTENGVKKARSVRRVPVDLRCAMSELKKVKGLPWNGAAENLQAPIISQQDQGPSGHRRLYLTRAIVQKYGATSGCSGCMGLGPHIEACRASLEKAIADGKSNSAVLRAAQGPIAGAPPPQVSSQPAASSAAGPQSPTPATLARGMEVDEREAAAGADELTQAIRMPVDSTRGRPAREALGTPERPMAKAMAHSTASFLSRSSRLSALVWTSLTALAAHCPPLASLKR